MDGVFRFRPGQLRNKEWGVLDRRSPGVFAQARMVCRCSHENWEQYSLCVENFSAVGAREPSRASCDSETYGRTTCSEFVDSFRVEKLAKR